MSQYPDRPPHQPDREEPEHPDLPPYPPGHLQYPHQFTPGYAHPRPPFGQPLRHSGLGISSTILVGLGAVLVVVGFVVATYLEMTTPGGVDEEAPEAILAGCGLIVGIAICLIGSVLGLISLFFPDRRKVFGIIGLAVGATIVIMAVLLILIGLMMP